jgi:hypothetical protein
MIGDAGADARSPTALYLIPRGDSDRPLASVVLTARPMTPDRLRRVIDEPIWRQTDVFELAQGQLAATIRVLRPYLQPSVDRGANRYGSFTVIIENAAGKEVAYLAAARVLAALADAASTLDAERPAISDYFRALARRLGG